MSNIRGFTAFQSFLERLKNHYIRSSYSADVLLKLRTAPTLANERLLNRDAQPIPFVSCPGANHLQRFVGQKPIRNLLLLVRAFSW